MRKITFILGPVILSLLVSVSLASAGGNKDKGAELGGSVTIAGSSTVYPVSVAIAEEFNRMHPKVEIPIQSTGTGGGFKNFFIKSPAQVETPGRPSSGWMSTSPASASRF